MKRFLYMPMFEADDGAGAGGSGEDEKKPAKVEFTPEQQAEVDRIASERAARERKKYADYDDLKTKLSDFEKAEEDRKKAAMTEIERAQAETAEALKKAQEAEEARSKTQDTVNQRLIRAELRLMAKELGVRTEALDDVFVLADRSAVTIGDDGEVVGAKEAVEALIKAKPYLAEAKKQPKQIGEPSNHDDKGAQKSKEQILTGLAEKARKTGRIEDRMAYAAAKDELAKL